MFANLKRIVEAAGGTTGDVIKMTVWMNDRSRRDALNHEWLKMFPDAQARPARHTMQASLDGGKLIECDIVAVLPS
jgi:2-iminobutanoate/2-iminopropanoate deaminase